MLLGLRKAWRRRVPSDVQLAIARRRRQVRDHLTGMSRRMVKPTYLDDRASFKEITSVVQPIRRTEHWEGKLENLRLGAEQLNWILVFPGRILSFWAVIGAPVEANGFRVGRSIRNDALTADIGGGLCQLSGLLYELGLRAGMQIVERHAHTRDLYTDETRFTALGLDATVVWGHKDLRLCNGCDHPLAFNFEVDDEKIRGRIFAETPVTPVELRIENQGCPKTDGRLVSVFRNFPAGAERVSFDRYSSHDFQS
jgi:vancomycin resistance protein VanW